MSEFDKDLIEFYPILHNRHELPVKARAEDDGTLRTWSVGVGVDANGRERPIYIEENRQGATVLWGEGPTALERIAVQDMGGGAGTPHGLIGVPYLWDGAAFQIIRGENVASGEAGAQKVSLYGTDDAANVEALRIDPNRVPWKRDYPAYVQVDPVEIPAADSLLWDVSAAGFTAANTLEVYFNVVNNDGAGAAVDVSVGADRAAGGGLAAPEFWLFKWPVPYPGETGWQGPFIIAGDDDIRGEASVANDASIRFRIRRVDLAA